MNRWVPSLLLCAACGDDPVTLTQVENEVFHPSCGSVSCHGGPAPQKGLNLSGKTFAELVGVPAVEKPGAVRIAAGDPAESFLLDKLLGVNIPTSTVENWTRMPAAQPLESERIDLVHAWIEAGALDN